MNVAVRTLALCAGYGGLELGLGAALAHLGCEHRVAAYVEREAYAAALLASRMETGALAPAPVWSDLTTFDAGAWRGAVDCVTAGFPCQPHSQAGSRKGTDDERWIWPAIAGIVRDSGAWLVVLENVPGLLSSGGFAPVLTDLAAMGFAAEWGVLSAGSVGASHRRERVFIVAYRAQHGRIEGWPEPAGQQGRHDASECVRAMADTLRLQRRERPGRQRVLDGDPGANGAMDNPAGSRRASARRWQQDESERGQCVSGDGCDAVADPKRSRFQNIRGLPAQGRQPYAGDEHDNVAYPCGPHSEGGGNAMTRPDGKSRLDMLDWAAESYSPPAQATPDGPPSSPQNPASRPRLNPAFVCWLMGLPPLWTNIEHTSFDAVAMASYRFRLRSALSRCLGDSE